MEKFAPDGPKWGQEDFLLLIQTLPTFWGTRILILRVFMFWIFWIPNFQISRSQISKFPEIWLGPSLGPLTWARRGPTHLGPAGAHPLAGTPRHGTERRTRRFMARPGTENLGTARHRKYWHGKIMARHGMEQSHKIDFRENMFGQKIRDFPKMQISSSSHYHKYLTYMGRWISKS